MAAVLDALAPYVTKLITDMAEEEVSMLLGVSGDITELKGNMESIKAFLADAERRRITDQSVQMWVRKLKDAMYDATDIIDLCQLEADDEHNQLVACCQPLLICFQNPIVTLITCGGIEKIQDFLQRLLFCLRNPVFADEIGSRIKGLNQRLENIHKGAAKFNFITNLGSNLQEPRKLLTDARISSQKTMSEFTESAIVGEKIENDTKMLAQVLINDDNLNIKVVSIVGTGGMGKTTLAQKIFNETTVKEHFKVKIWLSITQHVNETELLRTAIEHAGGVHGDAKDKTLLTRTLTDTLSLSRFLLVLDDVWSDEAWSLVLSVPVTKASQKHQGSRVLITTRLGDLAQRMGASFYQHRVSPLNDEDAWSLLNKQLPPPPSPNQVLGTDHLKDIGMKIIKKCGGLPLAIKVMGGLLSTRSPSERDWEAVLNHRAWSVSGLPEELDNRIYLSYEDLSPQLKQCFLYCSLFPKITGISQRYIVPMWISEGFIQPHDGSNSPDDDRLEEIATEYYEELITRNLIEPTEDSFVDRHECTMHDVVRSFAEFMAREESLVLQDRQVRDISNDTLVRHMSIGPNKLVQEWSVLQKQESVRTLIINSKMINFESSDSLTSFSKLRVLFINGANCDRLVDSLCQLRHLRYLHLEDTNISRLPEDMYRMKFLQHIVLDSTSLDHLPSSITQLVHLRTLSMLMSSATVVPKGFGVLTNLRSLVGFLVHMEMGMDGHWCSLEEIGPLSQLRQLTLHGLENVAASSLAETAKIRSKDHLNYLELHWSSSGSMEFRDGIEKQQQQQRAVEEVLEKLCPPPGIEHLIIGGYFGRMFPDWMMIQNTWAFKSLMVLRLQDLPCCTELPSGLGRLPSLKTLNIIDAPAIKSIGFEFQASSSLAVGGVVTATSTAFPHLAYLYLEGLCEWTDWDWEEQDKDMTAATLAMPALEGLEIHNCKLRCLPQGLANSMRHALRQLYLYELTELASVEGFSSVVELDMFDCPKLKRISGLSKLHKIRIIRCPNLEVVQGLLVLDHMVLWDVAMETLPGFLQAVKPRHLQVGCSKKLYESLSPGTSEWNKISHIGKCDISYNL